MKKKLLIIIGVITLVVIGVFIFIKIVPSDTKIDEIKTVHDIKFYNAKIEKQGKKYIFYVTLTTTKEVTADNFDANIKDKKGKSLAVLKGFIGNMKKGDVINVEIESQENLKKAYQVTYTVNAK
ncbi:MAG: hypothetical protein J6O56_02290 [Bacilli bacterium]|nr:hypothetical protein [Bacilli bacterium]